MTLDWKPANWPRKTYHAGAGPLSYTIDHNGSHWVLRAWKDGHPVLYRTGPTMKALKALALSHANGNR